MKLLHLDSSALGAHSVTRELSAAVVARWRAQLPHLQVEYRDLDAQPIPHLTGGSLAKANPAEVAEAEAVLQQFLGADVVVLGVPFYNFGIPSTLKAWIDRIAVAGKTFRYTETGPQGLAGGKRIIIASGRGGVYGDASPFDFQEAYLRQVFGFLGITDIDVVRAEGVALSPQHRSDALAAAHAAIPEPLAEAA
ncbi:FMN-dependent NADH-azoreductase [Vulcaniibacterium tengchongense]|uniref:FMN dependent NADH:quinone oxidoreductase n=1 Tax=Vulcaniibacterium tengchongense TaxID=1273429 RepID=A0A3N4VJ72_9GAMM|nr:NAD(P)H-dependent oxidoreductase [Vulcaniibacterium tengchongense]RPE81743.1 FMN-dependent NADH-azoreductase [Vulcaniibacterium tengchongense]